VAVWQFKIAFLPQRWLDAGGAIDSLFGDESYDTSTAWEASDLELVQRRIGAILPLSESWSRSQVHWGAYDTDDIQLFAENGQVQDLSVRFDMRRPSARLFNAVVIAAEELHLALLDVGQRRVVPRDVRALLQAAATSSAASFVKDPEAFLTSFGSDGGQAT
jgi:hypothetical protein